MKNASVVLFFKFAKCLAVLSLAGSMICSAQVTQKTTPPTASKSVPPPKPAPPATTNHPNAATTKGPVANANSMQPSSGSSGIDAATMSREAQQQQMNADSRMLVDSQNQSLAAQEEANRAAMHAGELAGIDATSRSNVQSRLANVKAALEHWQAAPPKGYSSSAPKVALADPFEPPVSAIDGDLKQAVRDTCLEIDEERTVARVAGNCVNSGCPDSFRIGDYPVLADGNVLDSAERVHQFFKDCRSPAVSSVRLSDK
jgi:hypothetical protein